MSYYNEKRLANQRIAQVIANVKAQKVEIDINKVVLGITEQFAVSEKAVKERIDLAVSVEPNLIIYDGVLKWTKTE